MDAACRYYAVQVAIRPPPVCATIFGCNYQFGNCILECFRYTCTFYCSAECLRYSLVVRNPFSVLPYSSRFPFLFEGGAQGPSGRGACFQPCLRSIGHPAQRAPAPQPAAEPSPHAMVQRDELKENVLALFAKGGEADPPSDRAASPQLTRQASPEEIRRQFKRLALRFHPDKIKDKSDARALEAAEAKFKRVANAYEILSDPEKRRMHDYRTKHDPYEGRDLVTGIKNCLHGPERLLRSSS